MPSSHLIYKYHNPRLSETMTVNKLPEFLTSVQSSLNFILVAGLLEFNKLDEVVEWYINFYKQ